MSRRRQFCSVKTAVQPFVLPLNSARAIWFSLLYALVYLIALMILFVATLLVVFVLF